MNTASLADENLFRRALVLLPSERVSLVDSECFEEDKRLSAGVGLLTEYIRSLHPSLPHVIHSEDGKPHFESGGFHISLSHAHDYVMAGISEFPIGVDLEYYHDDYEIIISHFFTQDEKAFLDSSENRKSDFFELWSRKESYIKKNEPRDIRTFSVLDSEDDMEFLSRPLPSYSCVAYVSRSRITEWYYTDPQHCLDRLT